MIKKWYFELENKYPDKRCHEMVVMPNHFHCILENLDIGSMDAHGWESHEWDAHEGTSLRGRPEIETKMIDPHETIEKTFDITPYGPNNKQYKSPLGNAIGWFKTMTTNEYIRGVKSFGWKRFDKKLWHWNYYDRVIRNDYSYYNISKYIKENPENWKRDNFKN
jgi:REP element-mobilizing transposase RayT